MRRTALAVTAAAATLVAVPLLSSCSSTPQQGAAAVLDDGRITVSQLQAKVEVVRDAQRASEQADEMIDQSGDLTVDTLNGMLQGRVIERAAADHGVTVSADEIRRARESEVGSVGSEEQLEAMYLQQHGIPPAELRTHYKQQLMVQGLIEELGINPQTQEGQAALGDVLIGASEDLGIDVSPRFGTWDNRQVRLAKAKTPWLKQVSAAAEESPVPGQQ